MYKRNFKRPENLFSPTIPMEEVSDLLPLNRPNALAHIITVMQGDNLVMLDVFHDVNKIKAMLKEARMLGLYYRVEKGGIIVAENAYNPQALEVFIAQNTEQKLPMAANPRQPYDMGYGGGNARMAKSQLASIHRVANHLNNILMSEDELPQWVHTKIATSLDRLVTASNYLTTKIERMSEMKRNPNYIKNGDQFCVTAWLSAILLHPLSAEELVSLAADHGFQIELVDTALQHLLDSQEVGTFVDEDGIEKFLDIDYI